MRKLSVILALLLTLTAALPAQASEAVFPPQDEPQTEAPSDPPAPAITDSPETQEPEIEEPSAAPEEPLPSPDASGDESLPPDPTEEPTIPVESTPQPEEMPVLDPAALDEGPVISVTVQAAGRIFINPYCLPTEVQGTTSTEQIVSETMVIINQSGIPITVSTSAVGQISELSSARFAPIPPQVDALEKEIFLYAEFQNEDGLWSGSYSGGENQLLICEGASEQKEVLLLDAGPSLGLFRLFGATSVSPVIPWGTEDEVHIVFTFTFAAAEPDEIPVLEEEQHPEEAPELTDSPAPEETPDLMDTPSAEETLPPELLVTPEPVWTPDMEPSPETEPGFAACL